MDIIIIIIIIIIFLGNIHDSLNGTKKFLCYSF